MTAEDIDATKAPLMDHLIELRMRLIRAVYAFFAAFLVCFYFSRTIYNVLTEPYVRVVGAEKATLIATHFLEQFYTNIRLSMFGAGVIAFPIIAVQIYKFVAPGLYKKERQAFLPYLIATPIFFALGALLVYFVVMPLLIRFSVSLQQVNTPGEATIELLPKVSEYLSLIMTLIFAFGAAFQLPVVLTLLGHAGIVSSQYLSSMRRYAIVAVTGIAAILTPPDLLSMTSLVLPMLLLYEGSVIAVRFVEKRRKAAKRRPNKPTRPEPRRLMPPRDILAAIAVAVVWGLTFIAIKFGVAETPPLALSALRFVFAALPRSCSSARRRRRRRWSSLYGLLIGVGQFGLLFLAVREGFPVGLASLVIQLQAFFTIFFAWALLGERPRRAQMVGAAIALRRHRADRLGAARRREPRAVAAGRRRGGVLGRGQRRRQDAPATSTCSPSSSGRASPRRRRCSRCRLVRGTGGACPRSPIRA